MEITGAENVEATTSKKANPAKVGLLILPILGICLLFFCAGGSGLILWQSWGEGSAEKETAFDNLFQRNQAEDLLVLTATPATNPIDSSQPTTEAETLVVSACPEVDPLDNPGAKALTLSPISFATRQDSDGWPTDTALQFTTAVTRVLATFSYDGMSNGLTWERVWSYGDQELSRGSGTWDAGPRGKLTVQVMLGEGSFAPGRYKLQIYGEGQLLSQGAFMVVKADTPTQRPVQVAYSTWDGHAKRHQLNLLDLSSNQTEPVAEYAHSPAWSTDATGLLFFGENGIQGGTPGLWVLNVGQRKTYQVSQETFFQSIAWSPQRGYVASTTTEGQSSHLVLWDLNQHQAYDGPAGEDPAWSPEGQRLAYRGCDEAGWHINTIEVIGAVLDTKSIRPLTTGDDSQPSWSWDGQRIAFVRREGDNQDIYAVRTDGSNLIRLTDTPGPDVSPAWTPDHHLVFRSWRDGQWSLYLMNPDGSSQRQLISTPSPPDWQPDRLAVSTDVLVAELPPPQPQIEIPAGHGMLGISNQKNNDVMTFTIDNKEHKIGPYQVRMLPLRPGHYTWTASWPGKNSRTGIADVAVGQIAYPVVER